MMLATPVQANVDGAKLTLGKARFTVISPEAIRIEYQEHGQFIDSPTLFAIDRTAGYTKAEVTRAGKRWLINTGQIRLSYLPDDRPFHAGNLEAWIKISDEELARWIPGRKNQRNLGGTIPTLDRVDGPIDLGEGLLSRDGWYLLDDSAGHLLEADWVKPRPKTSGTDWYLFGYGTDYRKALRAFTAISGKVPLPRKYALGSWYSRWWPYTSSDYRGIVGEFEHHGFPLDVMVMDMDWHLPPWTGWTWNRQLLPDAEALLSWFKGKGIAVTLNDHPAEGVHPHEEMYAAFMSDLGVDPAAQKVVPFDAANQKYMDTLFKHTHTPHENAGVDFWWLDWQQSTYTLGIPDLRNLSWLNHYYYRHSTRSGQRGLSFSRWGGWGDHRNPIHFSGDAHTGFPMLAFGGIL